MNRHAWREVRRQLGESGAAGLVAVLLVMVSTALGGLLVAVHRWVKSELLPGDRPAAVVATLRNRDAARDLELAFTKRFPQIEVTFAKPQDVRNQLSGWFPELSAVILGLKEDAFPMLLQAQAPARLEAQVTEWLAGRPEVGLVESSRSWQRRMEGVVTRLLVGGYVLASVMLLGCCVVVVLVVRLLVLLHADEIAIMRLIGAHEAAIRVPYLASGAILGLLGGALGVGLLVGATIFLGTIAPGIAMPPSSLGALPAVGALAGGLGAALGLAALPQEP